MLTPTPQDMQQTPLDEIFQSDNVLNQVSMEVSAGKLEGVEGGSAGVPSSKEVTVRVVPLRRSDMGVLICGGMIGKDGRMCILKACSMASHRVNKCWDVVFKDSPSDTTLLCIGCAPTGGSGKSTAVFVDPTIPLEKLNSTTADMERTIVDWKILFRSEQNQPDLTSEEEYELAERSSKSSSRGLLTFGRLRSPAWSSCLQKSRRTSRRS
jgi:hypothetical protein